MKLTDPFPTKRVSANNPYSEKQYSDIINMLNRAFDNGYAIENGNAVFMLLRDSETKEMMLTTPYLYNANIFFCVTINGIKEIHPTDRAVDYNGSSIMLSTQYSCDHPIGVVYTEESNGFKCVEMLVWVGRNKITINNGMGMVNIIPKDPDFINRGDIESYIDNPNIVLCNYEGFCRDGKEMLRENIFKHADEINKIVVNYDVE